VAWSEAVAVAARSRPARFLPLAHPLILLLPALAGCGLFAREREAGQDLSAAMHLEDPAARDEALRTLRGAEPLFAPVWLASASVATSPDAALALVERGLSFRPASPDLLLARLSLLSQLGRRERQLECAQAALAQGHPAEVRAEVLWFLADALLGTGRLEEAEDAVLRLGGLPGDRPDMTAAAWARLALARELAGDASQADRSLRASLDLGPQGLSILRRESLAGAERADAAHRLVERAAAGAPEHPDLRVYLLVDRIAQGDLPGAQAALDALPAPLPERLLPEREALQARVLVLQDRVEEGLAIVRARLAQDPADPLALAVLLEAWHLHRQPGEAELVQRLQFARGRLRDPLLARQVSATLAQLQPPEQAAAAD
jgi:tetratricopeptide (TPR) repeat protein